MHQVIEVTSQWYLILIVVLLDVLFLKPWEERLQKAQEWGTLVLLENLEPTYSSSEVEVYIDLLAFKGYLTWPGDSFLFWFG